MAADEHAYWLFRKDTAEFSFDSLKDNRHSQVLWTGVRGDEDTQMLKNVRKHDVILFCSNGQDSAILGMMEPTGDPIPDMTAYDPEYSKKHWVTPPDRLMPGCSIAHNPFWAVPVKLVAGFRQPVRLSVLLSAHPCWAGSEVSQAGRTVIPVTEEQWDAVVDMSQA